MRSLINLLCIALFSVSLSVFAGKVPVEPIIYTQDKPVVMVTSNAPDFVIKLIANPTTGYSWFLRDYNGNLLTPSKHEVKAPENKKLVGAPGYEMWTFHVKPSAFIVPQQTMIRFVYARPWETADNSTQLVFKVTTRK